jgi:hypothetical protein
MATNHQGNGSNRNRSSHHPSVPRLSVLWFVLLGVGLSAAIIFLMFRPENIQSGAATHVVGSASAPTNAPARIASTNGASATQGGNLPALEINQAVMVTVELDFGGSVPTIAEALREIERRHQPDDGAGRTFAILDAYGGPTADGKKLHLSMHVSAEKPGIGALVFHRTGQVLWQNRLVATTNKPAFDGRQLTIYLDNGNNQLLTVDGSANPATLLEANIKEAGRPLRELWNDGDSREVVFIYSACGCPVKVMCQRKGDRIVRTSANPVIFPDDPAVLTVINRLMQW